MSRIQLRPTTQPRPAEIEPTWRIFNAPRPLYGDKLWRGDFIKGVFYAAVNPAGPDADVKVELNASLDADELVYVTEDMLVAVAVGYFRKEYGERLTPGDIEREHDWLWMRAIDLFRDGTLPMSKLQAMASGPPQAREKEGAQA